MPLRDLNEAPSTGTNAARILKSLPTGPGGSCRCVKSREAEEPMARILLIDDDLDLADALQEDLENAGHRVTHLERAESGPDLVARQEFDVVVLDNNLGGGCMSGLEFLGALKKRELGIPVILMTGFVTADTLIQAKVRGVFDYLEKPADFAELFKQLTPIIHKALDIDWRPQLVPVPAPEKGADDPSGSLMLGTSKPMQAMYGQIGAFAPTDTTIVIRGETGAGKELVARAIHTNSPRKNRPFVALNCTTLNENLLESELFGVEKGAHSEAKKLRKGWFEHADGGTLFLDEIGDMPMSFQAKLLRVLENHEITRVGGNETIRVDVRVLSATHRDLEAAIRAGTFREDLYYRLNGVSIHLPPLRERGADLQLLTHHFLARAAVSAGRRAPTIHPNAWDKLHNHPWPGNIRELHHVISHAVLTCRGSQVTSDDIKLQRADPAPAAPGALSEEAALDGLRKAVAWAWNSQDKSWQGLCDRLERELLAFALAQLDGNQTQIGIRLGMCSNTVRKRLKKYDLIEEPEALTP
jgi:DNA-binding NtrC family response regulator